MSGDIAISARDLGKLYIRGRRMARHDSMREVVLDRLGTLVGRGERQSSQEEFWALKDATFDIRRGENVGIIGLNGAGKSTLLKILSRITTPTTGTARIVGRLGALLEVGTGFHQELTGRENAYLYGAILGMSQREVARKFDAIVDFSEIADFIDTPVKRYSSGMYVRLAFAVAAHLDPDILLLDEVLAVGDYTFQRKCLAFARDLETKGATILFVSHNMFSIKSMCQRVIYLKGGRVAFDGPTDEALKLYEDDCRLATAPWFADATKNPAITITDVQLSGEDGEPKTLFDFGERMRVRVRYETSRPIEQPNFLVSLTRSDDVLCCNFSTAADKVPLARVSGEGTIELRTPPLKLVSDRYTVSIVVRERGFQRILCAQIGAPFHVRHDLLDANIFGVFHEPGEWRTGLGEVHAMPRAGQR
jgi:lipopolysaccharide transport system ATP-binding protein